MPGSGQLNRLAYQFLRAGRVGESLKVFELFLALYPKSSFAHDGYAEALFVNKETERSIEYYKKALELNPQNAAALRMLKVFARGSRQLDR
jgi:tetratricopeptide (TPR) repeat protein